MIVEVQEKRKQDFLLGNEAIAWGAIEAGVDFVAGYPGTPSSEILETLARNAEKYDMYVEWSTNEMVAFENAFGASLAGQRAMVTMKHAGLNWVVDPLSVAVLGGVKGGLIIVTADDPNCHSSANEQDNRFYGLFLKILTLEPSDPQEAKEMTAEAFLLSEESQLPVILRSVTRMGHTRSTVSINRIPSKNKVFHFEKDPERFFITGARALNRHRWQLQQQPLLERLSENLRFNKLEQKGESPRCIVTSGVAYGYVKDALGVLGIDDVPVLKIGSVYPLPKSLIKEALSGKEVVLVVEEGAPFIELQLKALASDLSIPVRVLGKMSGSLPEAGELNVDITIRAIAGVLGRQESTVDSRKEIRQKAREIIPPRTMVFCAGCPHTGTMYALKKTLDKKKIHPFIGGDIGCYTLMCFPPHELGDVKLSMGASINMAAGHSKALKKKTIAVIGDSTFIHAGIPGLINCVYNRSNMLLVICDNRTTAMTGGQPHAGTGVTATRQEGTALDLKKLVEGCGVDFIEVTDSYDIKNLQKALQKGLDYDGPSVVISRGVCTLQSTREARRLGKQIQTYKVDPDQCVGCWLCVSLLACPALIRDAESVYVDETQCTGCSICAQICPTDAIDLKNIEAEGRSQVRDGIIGRDTIE